MNDEVGGEDRGFLHTLEQIVFQPFFVVGLAAGVSGLGIVGLVERNQIPDQELYPQGIVIGVIFVGTPFERFVSGVFFG